MQNVGEMVEDPDDFLPGIKSVATACVEGVEARSDYRDQRLLPTFLLIVISSIAPSRCDHALASWADDIEGIARLRPVMPQSDAGSDQVPWESIATTLMGKHSDVMEDGSGLLGPYAVIGS